jgi:hypothetical protein
VPEALTARRQPVFTRTAPIRKLQYPLALISPATDRTISSTLGELHQSRCRSRWRPGTRSRGHLRRNPCPRVQ